MLDLNQVMQRLKHTVVNTRGIPHTWQKGTIFSNKTTENWRFILSTKLHTWHYTGEYILHGACRTFYKQTGTI